MVTSYLVRAQLEFGWEFEKKEDRQKLVRPDHLPVMFGPFKLDVSPNFRFQLIELGWLEPDTKVGSQPDWEYPVSLLYIESRLEVPETEHPEANADDILEQLEALFRLFQPGDIYIRRHGFPWQLQQQYPMFLPTSLDAIHSIKAVPTPVYNRGPYRLDDAAVARFVNFFNLHWDMIHNKPPRLYTALYRFSASYERRTLADRLTELVIALEALFGDDDADSVTYKIALRCASWIYPLGEAREKAFHAVKKVYSDRSNLVHGRRLESTYSATEVQQLEDYVRRALVLFLDQSNNGTPITSGKQLDQLLFLRQN